MREKYKNSCGKVPHVPLHQNPYPALNLGPGETARLTIPYRGFADRVEVDEIRVIV